MCQCVNRVVLVVVNVIFAIFGAALLGVSLWIILSQNTFFQFVKVATQPVEVDDATLQNYVNSISMLTAAAWVTLVFGAVSMLVGFCGCLGAAKESSCLLIIYSILVVIILIAEISGAVVAIVFKSQIEAELQPRLQTLVRNHYLPLKLVLDAGDQSQKNVSMVISGYINYMHVSLECCGIVNITDVTVGSQWSRSSATYNGSAAEAPQTCCRMKSTRGDLLAKSDWANLGSYMVNPRCPTDNADVITKGCYATINSYIATYTWPIIIAAIVIGLVEILFVVMACSLIQKIRNGEGQKV